MGFLHRSDVWRMGKYFFNMVGMFGRVGLCVNTKGILSLSLKDPSFLYKAFHLGVSKALFIAA